MPRLAISALPALQVLLDGSRVTNFRSTRAQALLIYLAVEADRPHPRELLAGLLWPDEPEPVARHNLGQTLVNLRRAIGDHQADPPFLLITRKTIQFNPDADAQLDVASLSAALDACRNHAHPDLADCAECAAHLQQAVDLYRGPFLDTFALQNSDLFEEWVLVKREWLRLRAVGALEQLVAFYLRQPDYGRAEQAARRLVALDPLSEPAQRELMRALALGGQRAAALAQYETCRQLLAEQLAMQPAAETTLLYEEIRNGSAQFQQPARPAGRSARQDWGQAPEPRRLYGRDSELDLLVEWMGSQDCRLIAILGMGGIGKTTLAARAAQDQVDQFQTLFWRSLRNAPPVGELLADCLRFLHGSDDRLVPNDLDGQLQRLLDYLRRERCLLILDNAESLFEIGGRAGQYRSGYAGYAQLFQAIGAGSHQSCLLLTSREQPRELARLVAAQGPVRLLQLAGLSSEAGWQILNSGCPGCEAAEVAALVERYSGNPLALQLVADTIAALYAGNIGDFLRDETLIFEDIRDVLDQQFSRLGRLEREILFWLMIRREPCRPDELTVLLFQAPGRSQQIEALRGLQQRSLLEKQGEGFTLQHVVSEYLAECCIAQICQEIEQGHPELLASHALLLNQVPEYVRQSQRRLLLAPIAEQLQATLGAEGWSVALSALLEQLRADAMLRRSYAAGNLLNLAVQADLLPRGCDFSDLAVRQANLRAVNLPALNFRGADLSEALFTDSFSFVTAISISPDGKYLAAASGDTCIRIWDLVGDQLLATCNGHSDFVWELAFSSDSRLLASASWDKTIALWEPRSGNELRRLHGHSGRVRSVAFSPDDTMLASGGEDRSIRLWHTSSGRQLQSMVGHIAAIRTVSFSRNGLIASAGEDAVIHLWDLRGQIVQTLPGHTGGVWSIAFSPDDTLLVSGGEDRCLRLWQVADGRRLAVLTGHSGAVWRVAFSPDGSTIASSGEDRTVRIYETTGMTTRQVLRGHHDGVWALSYSPDGKIIASGGEDQTIRLWDARTGLPQHSLQGYTNWVYALAYAAGSRTLASAHWDGKIRLWDRSGQLLDTLAGHEQRVRTVAYNHDGTLLASGSEDQTIRLWDAERGRQLQCFRGHRGWVRALQFSRQARLLFSAGADQTVRIWHLDDEHASRTLETADEELTSLALFPAENMLAAGGEYGNVYLWDVQSGALLRRLSGSEQAINDVLVTADGMSLVSAGADHMVRIWDLRSGTIRQTLAGHSGWVWALALAPDGTTLASAGADHMLRLWDLRTGECRQILRGHSNWVRAATFAADGSLASAGVDEQIKIWDVFSGECRATLRAPGPYAGCDITGASGLSPARRRALRALGAFEDAL